MLRMHNTVSEAKRRKPSPQCVTVDDKIATNLATKLSIQYHDPDDADDYVEGFLRLRRNS